MYQDFLHSSRAVSSGRTEGRRAKRGERKLAAVRVTITPRDKAILRALGDMKFLRTSQLARVCFGRLTSTVRLRLRKLMDAGLIRSWQTSLAEENVYSLDRKGLTVIEDEHEQNSTRYRVPRRLERRLDHLTAINDFRITLSCALAAWHGEVVRWQSDWQLKRPGVRGLVPDALFCLRIQREEVVCGLEVDLGGEPAKSVFAAKLRTYAALRKNEGGHLDVLLVITTTTRRLFALLEVAAQELGTSPVLFTIRDKILEQEVLRNIWTSPELAFAAGSSVQFVSLLNLFGTEGNERYA